MDEKIKKCLNNLRYSQKMIGKIESALNSYGGFADVKIISEKTYKEFCLFIFNTELNNEEILKSLDKYGSYNNFIEKKNVVEKIFIKRNSFEKQNVDKQETKKKKRVYTTYSTHGHFQTKNPISAILNYIAMIPTYILMLSFAGIGKLFMLIGEMFSGNQKSKK